MRDLDVGQKEIDVRHPRAASDTLNGSCADELIGNRSCRHLHQLHREPGRGQIHPSPTLCQRERVREKKKPHPRTGTTFRPVHCDHGGEPGAVRACGRELRALQISGRAASGRGKGTASHVARAALRRRFGSSCFPWPTADGAWLPRWVAADLWFVDTARPLGRSVPTWRSDLRDRVGRQARGTCRTCADLHSLLEPRAHLESCGTERGRGEHLSACDLQR